MKGIFYQNGQPLTSNGHFRSNIEKDEESQQMYGWGSQNLLVATRYFIVIGFQWVFLRYNFAGLWETFYEEEFEAIIISGVLKMKILIVKSEGWYQIYVPSWRLSLKTEMRETTLVMAIPKETRKWKDQRGSWANCVAINGDVNAPRPENTMEQWATIGWMKECCHHMMHEEIPFLSLRCQSKPLRIHSLETPKLFLIINKGVDLARWHTWKDMPTPLMKYAITKTG
jgi:hypothetical protein